MNPKLRVVVAVAAMILIPAALCMGTPFLLVGVVLVDRLSSTTLEATVEGRHWTRTIEVQRWDRVERADWCTDVPEGAEIIGRENRRSAAGRLPTRRRHRTAHHGGSHPWCTFRITEWTADQPRVAEGTTEPRIWPEAPSDDACPEPTIGCLRGSTRTEALILDLAPEGREPVACAVSEAAWTGHAVGEQVVLPISRVFGRPLCPQVE